MDISKHINILKVSHFSDKNSGEKKKLFKINNNGNISKLLKIDLVRKIMNIIMNIMVC